MSPTLRSCHATPALVFCFLASSHVAVAQEGYADLGPGCCEGEFLKAATYLSLENCQNLCRLNKHCGYVTYGWHGSKFCQLMTASSECSEDNLQVGATQCGKGGGNTGVRTYKLMDAHGPVLRTMTDAEVEPGFPKPSDVTGSMINAPAADSPERVLYDPGFYYWQEQNKKQQVAKDISMAGCVINSLQSAEYLGLAGLVINSAVDKCAAGEKSHLCAADVTGVIAAFSAVASFISGAVAGCPEAGNSDAFCASKITGLIDAVFTIVEASNNMAFECVDGLNEPKSKGLNPAPWSWIPSLGLKRDSLGTAHCVMDSLTATTWIAKAGAGIASSIEACATADRLDCAANALGVTTSFLAAGSFFAATGYKCGKGVDPGALCAQSILGLIASLNGVAEHAVDMNAACGGGRRLQESNATAGSALHASAARFNEFIASHPDLLAGFKPQATLSRSNTTVIV